VFLDSPILSDPYQHVGCPCPLTHRDGPFCRLCGSYHPGTVDIEVLSILEETETRRRRIARLTMRQRRPLEV